MYGCDHERIVRSVTTGQFQFGLRYYDTLDLAEAFEYQGQIYENSQYETLELVEAIKEGIKSHELDPQEFVTSCIESHRGFRDRANNGHLFLRDLDNVFLILNEIFFDGTLPSCQIGIFRREIGDINPTPEVIIQKKITFDPLEIIVGRGVAKDRPATIILPSTGDQFGAFLEAMIELYLRWYGCHRRKCYKKMENCGKEGRGEAWQTIAYILETSNQWRTLKKLIGAEEETLRRKEEYVRELSRRKNPRNLISQSKIREWGWESETVSSLVAAAEKKKVSKVETLDMEREGISVG